MTQLAQIKKSALALPAKQRIRLVQDIWDSIAAESDNGAMSPEHRRIVEEREAAHEKDPSGVISLAQLKRRLRPKLAGSRENPSG